MCGVWWMMVQGRVKISLICANFEQEHPPSIYNLCFPRVI
jgi:hypothetical protein